MNALQSPPPIRENPRPQRKKRYRPQKHPSYLGMTFEIALKVLVNGVLSAAAITALMELLPYHISQKAKLEQIQQEVYKSRKELEDLRQKFDVSFSDPKSALSEVTTMVKANQLRVIFDNESFHDH